jgi:DNA polymerase-3 subunit beta
VTATDLELMITTPLAGATAPVLLPFVRLQAIVNTLSDDEVTFSPDGTSCTISCGGGSWRLPVEDANEFPVGGVSSGDSIGRLPCDQFRALVSTVKFATDNDTSRFALGGVLIEFRDGTLTFVASDGRRMCIASCELDQALDNRDTLVPRRVIDVLYRIAARENEAIQLETTGKKLVATIGGTVVESVLVDGKFPRWRDVEPNRPHVTSSLAVVGSLLHACEMAAICESEASRGTTWAFTKDGLWITAKSSEYGESSATCDLVQAGTTCTVKLDPRFAVEWLSKLDPAETVEVEAESESTAVVFRAGDCRNVVMPLAKE